MVLPPEQCSCAGCNALALDSRRSIVTIVHFFLEAVAPTTQTIENSNEIEGRYCQIGNDYVKAYRYIFIVIKIELKRLVMDMLFNELSTLLYHFQSKEL